MSWDTEHGPDYDVPAEVTGLEGINDWSWKNDTCPRFGVEWDDHDIELDLDIWVEHPDPDQRESASIARFHVVGYSTCAVGAEILDAAEVPDAGEADGFQTNDVASAVRQFVTWKVAIDIARKTTTRRNT